VAHKPTVLAVVESTRTGEQYEIRLGKDGVTFCACMGWRFSKERPRSCTHVREYQRDVALNPAPAVSVTAPWEAPLMAAPVGARQRAPVVAAQPTPLETALAVTQAMLKAGDPSVSVDAPTLRTMADVLRPHLGAGRPPVAPPSLGAVRLITFWRTRSNGILSETSWSCSGTVEAPVNRINRIWVPRSPRSNYSLTPSK
jgi:hypothetical protein